jgi:hypothetical protein
LISFSQTTQESSTPFHLNKKKYKKGMLKLLLPNALMNLTDFFHAKVQEISKA